MNYKLLISSLAAVMVAFITSCGTGSAPPQQDEATTKKSNDMPKVAVLTGEGFHDGEAYMPMSYLYNRGAKVTVIGPEPAEVNAYNSDFTIVIEKSVNDVSVDDFDALILPGGEAPSMLRDNPVVVEFAKDFYQSGKPVAAICHGPQILITAGVMEGVTCTAFEGVKEELEEAGANYVDESVVIDQNLITSRIPTDLNDFSSAIYQAIR
ncbi:type 1 glutamine amidotransferase [Marinilabiliaceae bacterium ANBcel2]|nr:type 1 glutamine amidotransferase [Marinilabiliaceae bacterium ANBcel2]